MIRCALCLALMPRSSSCSDLAVLTLHQMETHPAEYAETHPETRPYLVEAGLL